MKDRVRESGAHVYEFNDPLNVVDDDAGNRGSVSIIEYLDHCVDFTVLGVSYKIIRRYQLDKREFTVQSGPECN